MRQDRIPAKISTGTDTIIRNIKTWDHLKIDIEKLNNECWIRRVRTKTYYLNYPLAFDIETSSFMNNGEKQAITYVWQFAIGDNVYMGRTWVDFMDFLKQLTDGLKCNEHRRIVIYVHNLSYEFQFMRLYYDWLEVFALNERKVCYATTVTGAEFRCSYILTNESLANLAKSLRDPIEKLTGELDYNLIRSPNTPLDDNELAYCVNDVRIITHYIRDQIEIEGDIIHIPWTKTGYVRRYCKKMCLYGGTDDKYKRIDSFLRYNALMKRLTLTRHEYMMLKRAFAGGFTHANIFHVGKKLHDVHSQDLTSSYPTVCLCETFPMSKGKLVHPTSFEEFDRYVHKYCCVFDVRIYGIKNTFLNEAVISYSKCWDAENVINNNGRIESADMIAITITEQDYFTYAKFYDWDRISVGDMYIYRRGYLPTPLVESILKFYTDKTVLKGLTDEDGHELHDYSQAKGMLNSTYGMMVTDICRPEIEYTDGIWSLDHPDYDTAIEDYNNSRGRFLHYPWGVWVTSHARRNILQAIYSLKDDYVYSDTDSVKYLHPEDHREFFDHYNNEVVQKLYKAMKYHGLPEDSIRPCNQKGEPKPMGIFTDEGSYTYFKTLGAKRYMYTNNKGTYITVAGLGKKQGGQYIAAQPDPYEFFNNDMFIPADHTGKLIHTYIDDVMTGSATDYQGNRFVYYERSGIHLGPCEFSLSLTWQFLQLLGGITDGEE